MAMFDSVQILLYDYNHYQFDQNSDACHILNNAACGIRRNSCVFSHEYLC